MRFRSHPVSVLVRLKILNGVKSMVTVKPRSGERAKKPFPSDLGNGAASVALYFMVS